MIIAEVPNVDNVTVVTADEIQGLQFNIGVMDHPASDKAGFTKEKGHFIVAFSRWADGFYWITGRGLFDWMTEEEHIASYHDELKMSLYQITDRPVAKELMHIICEKYY